MRNLQKMREIASEAPLPGFKPQRSSCQVVMGELTHVG